MKINWSLRLKNKTTLLALCCAVITLVYKVLSMFAIVPVVSESTLIELVGTLITILVILGIVTDPTTKGVCDSSDALDYKQLKENCNGENCSKDNNGNG